MKIAIVAAQDALPVIKKSFSSQRCVGVEFEYYEDINEVLSSIETRGFYLDKLVVITAFFQDWGPIDRQTFVNRLLNICQQLREDAEIYLVDSKQIFRSDYSNLLSAYPQVKYQSQQIHVSELFGLVTGDIKQEKAENIEEDVKPKGLFSKLFSKKNNNNQPQQEFTEDTALITEEPAPAPMPAVVQVQDDPAMVYGSVTGEQNALYNIFDELQAANPTVQAPVNEVDDTPLFEEPVAATPIIPEPLNETPLIPEPQPQVTTQIPIPTPIPEPQEVQPQQSIPTPEPQVMPIPTVIPTPPPAAIPVPTPTPAAEKQKPVKQAKVQTPKVSKVKSSYVDIFQKRTKIILCTGDRRSGISTVASNMAQQAVNDGLAVLVLDLDFERKGQAINFPFEADENDTQLAFSLFRAASSPMNVKDFVVHLEDGLDFLGTALSVSEVTNIHNAITNDTLKLILSSALAEYDLIFIDCPYEYLKEYSSLASMAHIILHSMMTDYRSILNTLNALTPDDFESDMHYNLYLSKMMLLLNNFTSHFWNSTEINEKTITSYMCALTGEDFYRNIDVVGRVPNLAEYDRFMDAGALFVSDKNLKNIFIQLLNDIAARG